MRDATLKDLYNPNNITGLYTTKGALNRFKAEEGSAFQEYPRMIELWGETKYGTIIPVKRWRKSSIAFVEYNNSNNYESPLRAYIEPKP